MPIAGDTALMQVPLKFAAGAIRLGPAYAGTRWPGQRLSFGCLGLLVFSLAMHIAAQTTPGLDAAKKSVGDGNYARAEGEFRSLLVTHPNSPEILDDLGIALQLQDKSADAIATFERVLKLKRFPDAVALLAVDYCRNHDFDRATPLLKEAKAFLSDPNIMASLGSCYLEADQPDTAAFIYEKLVELGLPPEDENAVNLIRAHFDLSRKLFETLASLPPGFVYARAIQTAKSDGSLDASSLFPKAYENAPYLKPGMSIEEMIGLLASHPNDPPLLYILGVQCAERADEEFDRAQDKWPGSLALSQLIAELKDSQGDRDGAIQQYEEIIASHHEVPDSVHFALGLLYAERRRWPNALQQYSLIKSEAGGSLYLKQRMSEAQLHLGDNRAVMELLKDIVSKPVAPFWALRDYGVAVEGEGQERTAIGYLKRASAMDPGDALIHYHLMRIYHKLNDPKAAAAQMVSFKQLSEQHGSGGVSLQKPHLLMAEKFDRLHQTKKAEAEWRAALAIDPDSAAALDGLSNDLIFESDYPGAVALLEDPQLVGERTSVQILNLGLAYAGTGKLEESARVLRDGLNTAPGSLPIANELAEVLHKLGRSEEALTVLDLALERHPEDLNTKIHFFRVLIDTNPNKAAEKGRSLLQTFPNNWEILYLNGILETKGGKLQQARSYLERSARLKPDSAAPHAALGEVLAKLKEMRGAKEQLEKAIALGDKDDDVKQTLSTVLISLGEGTAEQ